MNWEITVIFRVNFGAVFENYLKEYNPRRTLCIRVFSEWLKQYLNVKMWSIGTY